MPRYLIQWRPATGSGNGSWTGGGSGSREIDTGATIPTLAQPVEETVTGLPNGQALEVRAVRLLDTGLPSAVVSGTGSVVPSRLSLDGADPFAGAVRLAWTDQRNWQYYRVERWTTATTTPAPGDITTTEITLASPSTSGTVDISGLINDTPYRFRINRISGPLGAVTRIAVNVLTATPQTGFDAPPAGFTALGSSVVSGNLKAQFATDASGRKGILVGLKTSSYDLVRVRFVADGKSTTSTISWTSAANFDTQQLGPGPNGASTKSFFVWIPTVLSDPDPHPISIPGSSPKQAGAEVFLDSQGATTNFTVEPTYIG
jgi:hypothetical protein